MTHPVDQRQDDDTPENRPDRDRPAAARDPSRRIRSNADRPLPRPDRKIHCPFHELSVGEATAGGVLPARSLADASARDRDDPLRLVPPPVYFEWLTGLRVGRSGKLRCMFHDDQHPSLHVYPEPERGWYCFGCGRGGSIYDLAALLWSTGQSRDGKLRGRDFLMVRERLAEIFLVGNRRTG